MGIIAKGMNVGQVGVGQALRSARLIRDGGGEIQPQGCQPALHINGQPIGAGPAAAPLLDANGEVVGALPLNAPNGPAHPAPGSPGGVGVA